MQGNIQYDLIVVGGGTAGTLSAIAAAREGLKVAVAERGTCLGGMAASSGLTEMNAAGFCGAPLYRGIEREIFNRMISSGDAAYHFGVPMSSDRNVKVDRLRYNPEVLKLLLEEMAVEAGAELFYDMELASAKEHEEHTVVRIRNPYQTLELSGRYLIDGTGNATLVRALGGETEETKENARMVATLMFRISGADLKRMGQFLNSGQLAQVIREGREKGILKGAILALTPIPGTSDVSVNVTRVKFNHEDAAEAGRAVTEARSQIMPVLQYIRSTVWGLENAYLSGIAPVIGVRDARRIRGRYTLTIHDLEQMTEFEDRVAWGCYPMDVHDPVTNTVVWKVLPGVYHIPYRSLVPEGLHRTIVAGKCLCADNKAFGAVRVMPIMMNVGESAGYAAALAARENKKLDELTPDELRPYLDQKYRK